MEDGSLASDTHANVPIMVEHALLRALAAMTRAVNTELHRTARMLPADELMPLLLHDSAAVRAKTVPLLAAMMAFPDVTRASIADRWSSAADESMADGDVEANAEVSEELFRADGADEAAAAHALVLGDELLRCTRAASDAKCVARATASTFVSTQHAENALTGLALAVASSRPVLLSGPAGGGKSALVGELARRLGQQDTLIVVHMDEQIDSKVLIGTYVCTECAGEFAWQPGVVSQAVTQGRWLLLEDVDRAPLEVMSALAPLLEGSPLYLPGRATSIKPPPSFRLFATLTVHTTRTPAIACVARSVHRPSHWLHIHIQAPTAADLCRIVASRYPLLVDVAKPMVGTLFALLRAVSSAAATDTASVIGSPLDANDTADANDAVPSSSPQDETAFEGARIMMPGGGRVPSSRDLLRWCARTSAALSSMGGGALPQISSPHLVRIATCLKLHFVPPAIVAHQLPLSLPCRPERSARPCWSRHWTSSSLHIVKSS